MGTVHDLLQERGKQGTLNLGWDRRVVETASEYLSDEESNIAFAFSGWAQVALPHKRLADDEAWSLVTDRASLLILPGGKLSETGEVVPVGVPFGSRARMIMLYLQTEAIRTQSREVELGKSLRNWLAKMGISIGGKSVKEVRDQAERLSHCRLTLEIRQVGKKLLHNQQIVERSMFLDMDDNPQGTMFLEAAQLSESFFEQLKKHPVPIEDAAIKAISNHSMTLDIYLWLAYRLHVLQAACPVSWGAVQAQFGRGFKRTGHFRAAFQESLQMALAVYPTAKVEVGPGGLTLHPSAPPIARKPHVVALPAPKAG